MTQGGVAQINSDKQHTPFTPYDVSFTCMMLLVLIISIFWGTSNADKTNFLLITYRSVHYAPEKVCNVNVHF